MGAGLVQALHFHSSRALTLARGDAVRPLFQQVVYAKEDAATFEPEITLPKYQHQHLMSAASASASSSSGSAAAAAAEGKKRKANNEPVNLGAQHMADMVQAAQSGLDGDAATPKRAKLASTKSKSDGQRHNNNRTHTLNEPAREAGLRDVRCSNISRHARCCCCV